MGGRGRGWGEEKMIFKKRPQEWEDSEVNNMGKKHWVWKSLPWFKNRQKEIMTRLERKWQALDETGEIDMVQIGLDLIGLVSHVVF